MSSPQEILNEEAERFAENAIHNKNIINDIHFTVSDIEMDCPEQIDNIRRILSRVSPDEAVRHVMAEVERKGVRERISTALRKADIAAKRARRIAEAAEAAARGGSKVVVDRAVEAKEAAARAKEAAARAENAAAKAIKAAEAAKAAAGAAEANAAEATAGKFVIIAEKAAKSAETELGIVETETSWIEELKDVRAAEAAKAAAAAGTEEEPGAGVGIGETAPAEPAADSGAGEEAAADSGAGEEAGEEGKTELGAGVGEEYDLTVSEMSDLTEMRDNIYKALNEISNGGNKVENTKIINMNIQNMNDKQRELFIKDLSEGHIRQLKSLLPEDLATKMERRLHEMGAKGRKTRRKQRHRRTRRKHQRRNRRPTRRRRSRH